MVVVLSALQPSVRRPVADLKLTTNGDRPREECPWDGKEWGTDAEQTPARQGFGISVCLGVAGVFCFVVLFLFQCASYLDLICKNSDERLARGVR